MYISVFRWGSRSSRNYFSNVKTKAIASDSRKKTVRNAANRSVVRSSKKSFSRRFASSRRHKFSYFRNFYRSWSSRRCFWRRLRAVWAISWSRHQPRSCGRSVSCDRVNVNKPKLRNFNRPLGLPSHLQWNFWHRQRVISSKYNGAGAWSIQMILLTVLRDKLHEAANHAEK